MIKNSNILKNHGVHFLLGGTKRASEIYHSLLAYLILLCQWHANGMIKTEFDEHVNAGEEIIFNKSREFLRFHSHLSDLKINSSF